MLLQTVASPLQNRHPQSQKSRRHPSQKRTPQKSIRQQSHTKKVEESVPRLQTQGHHMTIDIRAIPITPYNYWLDCNLCGPIGIILKPLIRNAACTHLQHHGLNPPEDTMKTIPCECGYDYANPTGIDTDTANCTTCDWTAHGMNSDHLGHHHYLTTHHYWTLTIKEHA
jgi:hypothetical protein